MLWKCIISKYNFEVLMSVIAHLQLMKIYVKEKYIYVDT